MSAGNANLAETKVVLLEMVAEAEELKTAAGGSVTDAVAGCLAPQYLLAMREKLSATDGAGRLEVLRMFLHDWTLLRRGDHSAAQLQIEREKLAEAKKSDQEKALDICLEEAKAFREVQDLLHAAFTKYTECKKDKP